MSQRILIACIGNIFLGDDGFGVEAARALARVELGANVQLVDFGIRGLDVAYALLEPWQAVILVDAVSRGEQPGTVYLLQPAVKSGYSGEVGLDPHTMDPARVLAMARSLGEVTAAIYIVGCEPLDFGDELEGRMGLSAPVEAAIPEVMRTVQDLLHRLTQQVALAAAD
jgi:hydrogenase maturation protease